MYKVNLTFKDGDTATKTLDSAGLDRHMNMFKNFLGSEYIVKHRKGQLLALDGITFIMSLEWDLVQ